MSWTPRGTPFSATDTTSTLALSLSSTRAPTAGDLMLVCLGVRNSDTATISSVVDDQGGTWTRLIRYATAGQFVEQWSGVAAASANTVITVTFSTAVQSSGVAQAIGSSVGSWFKQDEATGATSAGTTHTPGTVDAASGDLLSTMTTVATAYTLGTLATDYSQIGTMSRAICQRQVAAGTISPDGAWTTTAAEDTVSTHLVLREGVGGIDGTVSATAPAATASASGTPTITGAAAVTAPSATVEAADGIVGASASVAPAATVSASGTPVISGTATVTAPAATVAAEGYTIPADAAWEAIEAAYSLTGTAGTTTATAPASTTAASGSPVISGSASATAPTPTVGASNSQDATGTVQATAPAATASASGSPTVTGSSTASAPSATTSASGAPILTGTAAAVAPAATASATSETTTVEGTAAVTAPVPTVAASGAPTITGSVAAVAPAATVSASPAPVYPSLAVGAARAGVATFTVRTHLTE